MIASLTRELDQAEANANDAIGLIQTEEGALTETHSMLQRMTTLATQAANGTYSTADEGKTARDSIQKEVDELANEITRIAENTKYNGLHPLDGNNQTSGVTYDTKNDTGTATTFIHAADSVDGTEIQTDGKGSSYVTKTVGGKTTVVGTFTEDDAKATLQDQAAKLNADAAATNTTTATVTYKAMTYTEIKGDTNLSSLATSVASGNAYIVKDTDTVSNSNHSHAYTLEAGATKSTDDLAQAAKKSLVDAGEAIQLQVGPTAGETLTVNQTNMTFAGLFGADNKDTKGQAVAAVANGAEANVATGGAKVLDMGSVSSANSAITRIQNAINTVSSYRADLGAKQNRLEHTINNLKTTNENVTAAESRIRDTDMAKEIAAYTKNNILSQAAQSMLAQANQSGQGVLTLLRG